jgi:hypothetical protein
MASASERRGFVSGNYATQPFDAAGDVERLIERLVEDGVGGDHPD